MDSEPNCVAGKILRVDLTTGNYAIDSTMDYVKKFLGGRGVNWWLLYHGVRRGIAPYHPANLLIYGTGLLVGTLAPSATRFTVDSLNPLTGGIASSNSGGHFASELKYAGYDQIVFQGRARKPVYLSLDDDRIEIRDASQIWGKTTLETDDAIRDELDDEAFQISCIGPAGENQVKSACIITNRSRAAGRCGLGGVMGSKNLKAIAVRGSGVIQVSRPEKFMELVEYAWDKINHSNAYAELSTYGTLDDTPVHLQEEANIVVKNYQDGYLDLERVKKIMGHIYHDAYETRSSSCFVCPFHCAKSYTANEGPYAPLVVEKMESNAVSNFGANLYLDAPTAIMKAQLLCTEYGLDIDSSASALAWAFECYQRGLITKEDTDGLELNWGNHEAVIELIGKTAYRRGFGNILAEGVKKASEIIGRDSGRYAAHIKGMENREFMRSAKGWALGVTVALRGGGHTTGAPNAERQHIPPEICKTIWGIEGELSPLKYEGKPELVVYFERLHAVLDSLGICLFTSNWEGPDLLGPDFFADLVSAGMGWEMSAKDLMLLGERIHNVGKGFNSLHAGFHRRDDYPPTRLMKEPISSGPRAGERLDRANWDKMLDRYYELHDWDKKTGWQTRRGLSNLKLEEIAGNLEEAGKISK